MADKCSEVTAERGRELGAANSTQRVDGGTLRARSLARSQLAHGATVDTDAGECTEKCLVTGTKRCVWCALCAVSEMCLRLERRRDSEGASDTRHLPCLCLVSVTSLSASCACVWCAGRSLVTAAAKVCPPVRTSSRSGRDCSLPAMPPLAPPNPLTHRIMDLTRRTSLDAAVLFAASH